jgi:hypothetical protein
MSKLREGAVLTVDNRHSGGALFESGTRRCAHCQVQVIMNPLRQRERGWCMKCDDYVCDRPECRIMCTPVQKRIDDFIDLRK